jgi:hypothetical protein
MMPIPCPSTHSGTVATRTDIHSLGLSDTHVSFTCTRSSIVNQIIDVFSSSMTSGHDREFLQPEPKVIGASTDALDISDRA